MNDRFKILRLLFHSLVGLVNLAFLILFFASAFSDRISPEKHMLFSYLGLAFPVLFIINLCFLFYWMFLRHWAIVCVIAVSFFICKGAIGAYFPLHSKVQELPEENVIKVLTYNVMGFGYKDHTKEQPNPIVQYIAESDADIVCMQEYAVGSTKDALNAKKLAKALPMYPYRSVIPVGTSGLLTYGIAVYSKFPIKKSRKIKYKSAFNGSAIHELQIGGKKLVLFNNHLESFKLTTEDRGHYASFLKHMSAETFDGFKNSIEQKLGPAFKMRAQQADIVAREIEQTDADYLLVCGDFNDTPISYAHHKIQGDLTDAYVASGFGPGISYNENLFWFRIDNILCSRNMIPYNCTVDKVRYSDHYPVWCYLKLSATE